MTKNNENQNVKEDALDLSFFMPGKAEEVEEVKEVVSKRFKNEEGNPVPFRFKPIDTDRVDQIEKQCMRNVIRKNRVVGKEVDQARFLARIAVETTVYPNFADAKFRKAYKTEDPVEIAKKVLHIAGEYSEWLRISNQVNGFDDTAEELEEEVKN